MKHIITQLKSAARLLVISVFMFALFWCFRITVIQGESMEDTLKDGEIHIVTPLFREISYRDIVIVDLQDELGQIVIKRVIAGPNDTVWIHDNKIYVNGSLLKEEYVKEEMDTEDMEITLADDEYFICGDNRNYSTDSRLDVIGPVKREKIRLKMIF